MPIYEFYCSACHTLLNFFSPTVDTERQPECPRCGAASLERKPARFATLSHHGEDQAREPGSLDDERMEQALAAMGSELEAAGDTEDPRQMARWMRRFGEASGIETGPELECLIARLEAGEDPDRVEQEIEALADSDDADLGDLFRFKRTLAARRSRPPRQDETLYFF